MLVHNNTVQARQLAVQEMEAVVEFLGTVGFTGEDILQVCLLQLTTYPSYSQILIFLAIDE